MLKLIFEYFKRVRSSGQLGMFENLRHDVLHEFHMRSQLAHPPTHRHFAAFITNFFRIFCVVWFLFAVVEILYLVKRQ